MLPLCLELVHALQVFQRHHLEKTLGNKQLFQFVALLLELKLSAQRNHWGQVFWAVHRPDGPGLHRDGEPRVGTRDELDDLIVRLSEDGTVLVVGEIGGDAIARPDAADTARLAVRALAHTPPERFVASALTPVYLRDADVRIGWDERGGVRGGVQDVAGGAA